MLFGRSILSKSVVHVSCDEGFSLFGEKTLQCGIDGNWNVPAGICKKGKIYLIYRELSMN